MICQITMNWFTLDNNGLPWWLSGKEFAFNAGGQGLILGSRRSPGEGNGNLDNNIYDSHQQVVSYSLFFLHLEFEVLSQSSLYQRITLI